MLLGFYILLAVNLVWLSVLSFFLIKTIWHYQRLTKGVEKKDLKSLLEEILKDIKIRDEDVKELKKAIELIKKDSLKHIQKFSFMRYNPFKDTGGDQSFVLALLDAEDNGLVLSSYHGREGTRIYAKSIKKGKGENFALSDEEEKVVKEAKGKK